MKRAVFVDRDGTLNAMVYDATHGIMDSPRRPAQVRPMPGAGAFLRRLREAGFFVVVVTNQPGVAKGTLTLPELDAVNARLRERVARDGGGWDDLRFCPHHPKGARGVPRAYVRECACRKPKPGMLRAAAREHGLDLKASWVVGDGLVDVQAGRAAGCRTILCTRLKLEQIEQFLHLKVKPDVVAASLHDALRAILGAQS